MSQEIPASSAHLFRGWAPVSSEPGHRLASLEGEALAGGRLRVLLGPRSRFGARYFAPFLEDTTRGVSLEPLLQGLHRSGPLPSYNWIEVAETNTSVSFEDGSEAGIDAAATERLFSLLVASLPAGGHLMVEYDSPQRAETAHDLAHGVPALATPLGELLFRAGCGARFKDWQIAEGGAEGPRKLQAYKPPAGTHAERWREEAARELRAYLGRSEPTSEWARAARERAAALLPLLS
jgi:hypothetical protein